MRRLLAAFILCTLLPVWAVAECPLCDVPTGYENGIHNMTQLFVVVEGWEEEVEVMEQAHMNIAVAALPPTTIP
jgi:hypothetical protein